MDPEVQRRAQQRVNRIAAFRTELADLEREGGLVLTEDQRSRLAGHHERVLSSLSREFGVEVTESSRRIAWGMRIASLLGAVALGAALVLFLHRVWGRVPVAGQVGILTVLPFGLLVSLELASRRGLAPYYLCLLGLAAGIGLVMAQTSLLAVWNVAIPQHLLLAWGAFTLVLAYRFGLRLLLAAGLVLLAAYAGSLWIAAEGSFWGDLFRRPGPVALASAFVYGLPSLWRDRDPRDFGFVYRMSGAATGLIALLVLSFSTDSCCGPIPAGMADAVYQLAGLFLSVGVVVHGMRLGRGGLVNLGAGGFVVFLYARLHAWWWDWMPKYLFFLIVGLTAVGLLLVFRRVRLRLLAGGKP